MRITAVFLHPLENVRRPTKTSDAQLSFLIPVGELLDPIFWFSFDCQSAFKFDPESASNFDRFGRRVLAVALAPSGFVIVVAAFAATTVVATLDDVAAVSETVVC